MLRFKFHFKDGLVAPLCMDTQFEVANVEVGENGDLIITSCDGIAYNLGKLVGESGATYTPYIDEDNVLNILTN